MYVWNSSHKNPPEVGQEVYYFGPDIGIGIGKYSYEERKIMAGNREIELCPHVFTNNTFGVVDACDAPRWLPYCPKQATSWCPIPPIDYFDQIKEALKDTKETQ